MKKYIFATVAIIMITWFLWMFFSPQDNPDPNIYYFKGTVLDIHRSDNHAFGIIVVGLDAAYIKVIDPSFVAPNDKHFPTFRYHGDIGEVYCTIRSEVKIGYKIVSDTVTRSAEVLNNQNDTVAGMDMLPIFDETNRNYIISHSRLR